MRNFFRKILFLLLPLASLFFSTTIQAQIVGKIAPNIHVEHRNGYTIELNSLRGKYVCLYLWASWCPTATLQMAHWNNLHEKYAGAVFSDAQGFEVLSVSFDEKREAWESSLDDLNALWSYQCISPYGFESPVASAYQTDILPSSYLISPDGVVLSQNMGFAELDGFLSTHSTLAAPAEQKIPLQTTTNTQHTLPPTQTQNFYRIFIGNFGVPNFHNFDRLSKFGYIEKVETLDGKSQDVYIAPFYQIEDAQRAAQQLQKIGYQNTQVMQVNKSANTDKYASAALLYQPDNGQQTNYARPTQMHNDNQTNIDQTTQQKVQGVSQTYSQYTNNAPIQTYRPTTSNKTTPAPANTNTTTKTNNSNTSASTAPPKKDSPKPPPSTIPPQTTTTDNNTTFIPKPSASSTSESKTNNDSTPQWILEIEKRGVDKSSFKTNRQSKKAIRKQERVKRKRERLMKQADQLKAKEEDLKEQIILKSLYGE